MWLHLYTWTDQVRSSGRQFGEDVDEIYATVRENEVGQIEAEEEDIYARIEDADMDEGSNGSHRSHGRDVGSKPQYSQQTHSTKGRPSVNGVPMVGAGHKSLGGHLDELTSIIGGGAAGANFSKGNETDDDALWARMEKEAAENAVKTHPDPSTSGAKVLILQKERREAERAVDEARQETARLREDTRREREQLEEERRAVAEKARQDAERMAAKAREDAERLREEARLETVQLAEEARLERERLAEEARLERERIAKEEKKQQIRQMRRDRANDELDSILDDFKSSPRVSPSISRTNSTPGVRPPSRTNNATASEQSLEARLTLVMKFMTSLVDDMKLSQQNAENNVQDIFKITEVCLSIITADGEEGTAECKEPCLQLGDALESLIKTTRMLACGRAEPNHVLRVSVHFLKAVNSLWQCRSDKSSK